MGRLRRALDRRLGRLGRVEPFVRRLVAGGLVLVAGLWLVEVGTEPARLGGVALVAVGAWTLATAIRSQVAQ
jgi:hypothetical protein